MLRLVAACLGLIPLTLAQTSTSAADELLSLEQAWNEAHMRGDSKTLSRLWADDLEVAVPKMPVMKKGELIAFVDSGNMKFQRYETSDLRVRSYGQTAVVTGRLQRTREIAGNVVEDDWRFTKVYEHVASGWRVVSFHASDAPTPSAQK